MWVEKNMIRQRAGEEVLCDVYMTTAPCAFNQNKLFNNLLVKWVIDMLPLNVIVYV